jgi:imidazolonepropionase-like amidohydrolase
MGTLSIINAGVFDGVSDGLADGPVHVADGRIVSVGGPPQAAGQVIDARGGMVLPGLIDAHRHAYGISLDMMAAESHARDQDHDLGRSHVAGRPDPDPAVLRR